MIPGRGGDTPSDVAIAEKELVRRAKEGESRAFEILYRRYQHKAFAVAVGILRREQDALDVVQESFIKVFQHLDSFQGSSSFYTWLYRIVTNKAIDLLRRRGKASETSFDDMVGRKEAMVVDAGDLAPSRTGADPHRQIARRELIDHVNRALDTLSPTHRAVIMLREQQGLSYEEMSKVMKCSKGTIMSRLHHARKNLQSALAPYLQGKLEIE